MDKVRVHGDIRHLENTGEFQCQIKSVHGDIRHLETRKVLNRHICKRSWRHTPFRNMA